MGIDSQRGFLIIVALFLGGLIYLLSPILTPFFVAIALAYVANPLVESLEAHRRISRTHAVVLVFLAMFLLIALGLLILLPWLDIQLVALRRALPEYLNTAFNYVMPWLRHWLGEELVFDVEQLRQALLRHWRVAGDYLLTAALQLSQSGWTLLIAFAQILLIPIITFYLLLDWRLLLTTLSDLFPRSVVNTACELATEVDEVLGAFMRGQLLVVLVLMGLYVVGFWLCGLRFALLIGLIVGLVSFVPYLGSLTAFTLGSVAMLFQTGDPMDLLLILFVCGVLQLLENFVLVPRLMGNRIGLHPVVVILAVMTGGKLFGIAGMLLALPTTAVGAVLLRRLHREYLESALYGQPAVEATKSPAIAAGESGDKT